MGYINFKGNRVWDFPAQGEHKLTLKRLLEDFVTDPQAVTHPVADRQQGDIFHVGYLLRLTIAIIQRGHESFGELFAAGREAVESLVFGVDQTSHGGKFIAMPAERARRLQSPSMKVSNV